MAKLKSMTAYSRESRPSPLGTLIVEIRSVNRKHLDIKVSSPPSLREFDIEIHRWVSARISRGQLSIAVTLLPGEEAAVSLHLNLGLARQIKEAGQALAQTLWINDPDFIPGLVRSYKEQIIVMEDQVESRECLGALREAVESALDQLEKMKSSEGDNLALDMESHIHFLEKKIVEVEKEIVGTVDKRREKLREVLESAIPEGEFEEPLLREVCLYAEKVDIHEEIVRFRSHLEHFHKTMDETGAVGKKLEFIVQELFREVSTMASKSPEIQVKHVTIEMRGALEKIREQVQNIE